MGGDTLWEVQGYGVPEDSLSIEVTANEEQDSQESHRRPEGGGCRGERGEVIDADELVELYAWQNDVEELIKLFVFTICRMCTVRRGGCRVVRVAE